MSNPGQPIDTAGNNDAGKKQGQTNKLGLLSEAYKRGLLSGEKRDLFQEAVRRGLIPGVSTKDTVASPPPYKEIEKWAGRSISSLGHQISQTISDIEGRDRDIDYGPGAGFFTEYSVKRADNPREERLALERIYGKGNVGQDRGGNWWVVKDGKKVAVYGDNSPFLKRASTSILSDFPELAGMSMGGEIGTAVGATLGIETGPGATVTAAIGAGLGTAAGKVYDDTMKWIYGVESKTPKEEARALTGEVYTGIGGEVVGRGLSRLGQYALRPKEIPWIHVTPVMEKRATQALQRRMVPTVEQVTGGETYRLVSADQKLVNYVWGNPALKKNIARLNQEIETKLTQAGVPEDQIPQVMRGIINRDVNMDNINEDIVTAVSDYKAGLSQNVKIHSEEASRLLAEDFSRINRDMQSPSVDLAARVQSDIEEARVQFSNHAGGLYKIVDDLAGDRPLVDSGPIKDAVSGILARLPKTAEEEASENYVRNEMGILRKRVIPATAGRALGTQVDTPVMAYIRDMGKLPDKIPLAWTQRIRSRLLQMTMQPGLTPDVEWKELKEIGSAVDVAIDGVRVNETDKSVIDALDSANTFYREGIAKFQDTLANRLVKEAGRGGVEPEKVMDAIIRPGKIAQAERIMSLLKPDTRAQLQHEYLQSVLHRAIDPQTGTKVLGQRLAAIITKEKPMLDAVLGKDVANRLSVAARNASALEDGIPIDELGGNQSAQAIKQAKMAEQKLDKFMKDHFLKALAGDDPVVKDQAFDYVIRPKQVKRLKAALDFFGRNKPVASQLRQKLMARILSSSIGISDDPAEQLFTGAAMRQELSRWGREYLEEMYGKEMSTDLHELADTISVMSGKARIGAAIGIVAGARIMLAPFTHLGSIITLAIESELMAKPTFIKWLILGFKGDHWAIRMVNQTVKMAARAAAQGINYQIENTAETPPSEQVAP